MKLVLFLCIAISLQTFAIEGYTQDVKINIHLKEAKIESILKEIEKQSEYRFLYNSELIRFDEKTNVNWNSVRVSDALTELFGNKDIVFQLIDKQIVLFPTNAEYFKTTKAAQGITITGVVTDENGEPMPGANIIIKGTTIGQITDTKGGFSIYVPNTGVTLVFSFIGYISQELKVGNKTSLKVMLTEDSKQISEVVITALGIKRDKKALGYSASSVETEYIVNANQVNLVSALTGKVSGVSVNTTNSQPGAAARITIRGTNSINHQNQPIWILDGMPFESDDARDIDPDIIEDLTILKGAAATALYGSRASNGVILLTSKIGKKGAPVINYSFKSSFDRLIEPPMQKEFSMGTILFQPGESFGIPTYYDGEKLQTTASWGPRISDVPGAQYYDRWSDYKTGVRFENKINVSGATDKTNYFLNVGNSTVNGMLEPQSYNKTDIFGKVKIDVTHWLSANFSINYIHSQNSTVGERDNNMSYAMVMFRKPTTYNMKPIYNDQGAMRIYTPSYVNANWLLENRWDLNVRDRFLPTIGFEAKFLSDFKLIGRVGLDFTNSRYKLFFDSEPTRPDLEGRYDMNWNQSMNLNTDVMLNYSKSFLNDLLSFDGMLGYNLYTDRGDGSSANGKQFVLQGYPSFDNCNIINYWASDGSRYRRIGAYGQVVIGLNSELYYTFSARNDWSSSLPIENNGYFYYSNSLSYIFSRLLNISAISFGKIRASYATVGNDRGAGNTKEVFGAIIGEGPGGIRFPYNGNAAYAPPGTAPNYLLKPEISSEFEVGLEMKFLNNRFGFELAYYNKKSQDQIMSASIPSSTGYNSATMNIGEISNKGFELSVNATPVKTNDFTWNLALNWSTNKSLLVKMGPQVEIIGGGDHALEFRVGESLPVIAFDYYITDDKGRTVIVDDPSLQTYGYPLRADNFRGKERISGKVEPDWFGGIRSDLTYKNLTLSIFVDARFGGFQNNMTEQYLLSGGLSKFTADRPLDDKIILPGVKGHVVSSPEGIKSLVTTDTPNDVPVSFFRYISQASYGAALFNEKYRLQKTDFIRLRELTLSYQCPKKFLERTKFIKGLSVSYTGNNLWRKFDKGFTGPDPEYTNGGSSNAQGLNYFLLTSFVTHNIGFNITF